MILVPLAIKRLRSREYAFCCFSLLTFALMLRNFEDKLRNELHIVNRENAKFMQLVAERLRGCRLKKGWSQLELAEKADVSVRSVNSWEKTGGMPSMQNLRNLSETLGVSIPFLLGEDDGPEELRQEPKPYGDEKVESIRRQCHEYIDRVIDGCEGDDVQLGWTLGELKKRFLVREPAPPVPATPPAEEPPPSPPPKPPSSLLPSDIGDRVLRAASSRRKKGDHHPRSGTS